MPVVPVVPVVLEGTGCSLINENTGALIPRNYRRRERFSEAAYGHLAMSSGHCTFAGSFVRLVMRTRGPIDDHRADIQLVSGTTRELTVGPSRKRSAYR